MRHRPGGSRTRQRARALRQDSNRPEQLLWQRLRGGQLGFRFRRQEPIGRFIVDFVCMTTRLVIEVDGDSHNDPAKDARRDAELEDLGFRVRRFWNSQIYENLDGVVEEIGFLLRE